MIKHVLVVDVDHTLLRGNSSFLFGLFLWKQGVVSLHAALLCSLYYCLHTMGLVSIEKLHKVALASIFTGLSQARVASLVQLFWAQHTPALFNESVVQFVDERQKQGSEIVLLSMSPDFLIQPIAAMVAGVACMATSYSVNEEGIYTNEIQLVSGENKALYVRSRQNEAIVTAVSDDMIDMPMLLAADYAIVVRPKRRLRKMAQTYGWQIME